MSFILQYAESVQTRSAVANFSSSQTPTTVTRACKEAMMKIAKVRLNLSVIARFRDWNIAITTKSHSDSETRVVNEA